MTKTKQHFSQKTMSKSKSKFAVKIIIDNYKDIFISLNFWEEWRRHWTKMKLSSVHMLTTCVYACYHTE